MSDPVLGSHDSIENKTDQSPCLHHMAYALEGRQINNMECWKVLSAKEKIEQSEMDQERDCLLNYRVMREGLL